MDQSAQRVYWQQAAGDTDRNYVNICLKYGVILNGPGYAGSFSESVPQLRQDGCSSRKITDLRRFSEVMKDGDIVILRTGTSEVNGVGVVVGGYGWSDVFGDVDGWDMQHMRRVRWLWDKSAHGSPKRFSSFTMKQGDTTQRLTNQVVIDWVESLGLDYLSANDLPDLPMEMELKSQLGMGEIAEFLYDKGTSNNSIERLSQVIDDLHMIAKWYRKVRQPSEFETEAYLIIPLLRTLGWTPQKMALEWNHVDIALFDRLPREDKNLIAVVEAKKKGNSCLTAFSQARDYVIGKGRESCNRLIVSDGLRYGVYIRGDNDFNLHAYMNLTDFKDEYPIYGCKGIREALWAMTTDWTPE